MHPEETGKCEAAETKPSLDIDKLVIAVGEIIGNSNKRIWELEVRLARIEQARDREFEAELGRRLDLDKNKGPDCCGTSANPAYQLRQLLRK